MCVSVAVSVSVSVSVAALTVTVCGVAQLPEAPPVNVSVVCTPAFTLVSKVTSGLPPESRATVTVTSPLGCVFSRTVYSVLPPSATVSAAGDSTMPGVALVTDWSLRSAASFPAAS